jgi:ubiquinone/menaquinone biosynthesis C-methylase UbiE
VEAALLALLPEEGLGRLLDIGTGTGRLLELLSPRASSGLGVDASRAMLALARARLARPGLTHCAVRLADMYRLPLPDGGFDLVLMQMLLHHAEDPPAALAEAARVLRPGGRLVVVDLAPHENAEALQRLAHRWPGFSDAAMHGLLAGAGLASGTPESVPGPLTVRLWSAERLGADAAPQPELVTAR